MKTSWLAVIGLSAVLLLAGCGEDPNERANALYVAADRQAQAMREGAKGYTEALEAYRAVRKDIERIISKYDTSELAVRLVSGEARVAGMTLIEFRALEAALEALAGAEQDPIEAALVLGDTLDEEYVRDSVITGVARAYAQSGRLEQAGALIERSRDATTRAGIYQALAKAYQDAGQARVAGELLEQAHASLLGQTPDRWRGLSSVRAAQTALELGHKEVAERLYALSLAQHDSSAGADADVGLLVVQSEFLLASGERERALELLAQASDAPGARRSLRELALGYAVHGQGERALEIIDSMPEGYERAMALLDAAERLEAREHHTQAGEMRRHALEASRGLDDPFWKGFLLVRLAGQYTQAGQSAQARELIDEALPWVRVLEAGSRGIHLAGAARELALAEAPAEARALVSEALESLRHAEHRRTAAYALLAIGRAQADGAGTLDARAREALAALVIEAQPMHGLWHSRGH
ncbi:hypothetical protein [Thioalkalivibrio thiocyanodenitrificans]|uniref:hypothetical protein n=1 Tax=Thioalkalivibrio thiocyanodenitrificans TaxID=243063 RepID=UPI0003A0D949|nr:hypothetical protein [Thioalkalivibrio thiocyanodenitrificans]